MKKSKKDKKSHKDNFTPTEVETVAQLPEENLVENSEEAQKSDVQKSEAQKPDVPNLAEDNSVVGKPGGKDTKAKIPDDVVSESEKEVEIPQKKEPIPYIVVDRNFLDTVLEESTQSSTSQDEITLEISTDAEVNGNEKVS